MLKPDLSRMWETFIQISQEDMKLGRHIDRMRFILSPIISRLKKNGIIDWYCFLIHDRRSGVPTTEEDKNYYIHVRLALANGINPDKLLSSLSDDFSMTRKVETAWVQNIAVINKTLLKDEDVGEAWKIIGEQSEWLLNMLSIHKENVKITRLQISQFLHFYSNMTQLRIM